MCLEDFELHMIAEVNSSRLRTTGNIQVYKSYMKFTENIFFWPNMCTNAKLKCTSWGKCIANLILHYFTFWKKKIFSKSIWTI